jgi:hypothetical protein
MTALGQTGNLFGTAQMVGLEISALDQIIVLDGRRFAKVCGG